MRERKAKIANQRSAYTGTYGKKFEKAKTMTKSGKISAKKEKNKIDTASICADNAKTRPQGSSLRK